MTTADATHKEYEFTAWEFDVIFGICSHLTNREIAEHYKMAIDTVMNTINRIFDKVDVSNRLELILFIRAALNDALRRRLGESREGSADAGHKQT
jgi:DNA-binding NarL/FixJ family response regulator